MGWWELRDNVVFYIARLDCPKREMELTKYVVVVVVVVVANATSSKR
jgi:hypothetical protein